MAIGYQNLFKRIGKCVQAANYYATTFSTMKTNGQEFVQEIADQNLDALADGVASAVSSHISGLSSGCAYWQNKVSEILLEQSLLSELAISNPNLNSVLAALYTDMETEQEYVLESNTTVGSATKTMYGSNTGDLIGVPVVDAYSSAGNNAPIMPYFDVTEFAKRSQVGIVDTVYCRCTSSNVEGEETFTLFGNSANPPFSENSESLGGSTSITVGDAANLLSNGDMETYSAGFTGWTIDDAAGTLSQDLVNFYRGISAAKIVTLATTDTVKFTQTLAASLTPGRGYIMGCWVKSIAAEASGTVGLTGLLTGGPTVQSSFTVSGNTANLNTTAWQLVYTYVQHLPNADIDATCSLEYRFITSVNGVDGFVFDDFFLVPAIQFNGVAWALPNGAGRFRVGDLITVPITRSSPAVFQEFFRKTYGIMLPSDSTGNETISDSLAT